MDETPTNSSISKAFSVISSELPTTHPGRGTIRDGPGDAVWILTSAFIIFTMISGFGLVESGKFNFSNIQAIFSLNVFPLKEFYFQLNLPVYQCFSNYHRSFFLFT